jgi:hypothetical protein
MLVVLTESSHAGLMTRYTLSLPQENPAPIWHRSRGILDPLKQEIICLTGGSVRRSSLDFVAVVEVEGRRDPCAVTEEAIAFIFLRNGEYSTSRDFPRSNRAYEMLMIMH